MWLPREQAQKVEPLGYTRWSVQTLSHLWAGHGGCLCALGVSATGTKSCFQLALSLGMSGFSLAPFLHNLHLSRYPATKTLGWWATAGSGQSERNLQTYKSWNPW